MSSIQAQPITPTTFFTPAGIEVPAVTTDQMREIDRIAMEETSLDVPSGMDSTTGEMPGEFIETVWTMTLALPKTGLASGKAGQVMLANIGIPQETYRRIGLTYVPPFGDRFRVLLSARANTAVSR